MRAIPALLVLLSISIAGCGARSSVGGGSPVAPDQGDQGDQGPGDSCPAPLCSDNRRGTWRLEGLADRQLAGYLFTFDARGKCNGAREHFLLVLTTVDCNRNGDYVIEESTDDLFEVYADNLGGTVFCEGSSRADLFDEWIRLSLRRTSCNGDSAELDVSNNRPGSLLNATFTARRCRCDISFEPCVEPMPDDPCKP